MERGLEMIIKPSTVMRNNYKLISEYAHHRGEIIYLTKRGVGDLVVMSISTFEKREEQLKLYNTVMQAETGRQKDVEEAVDGDESIARLKAKFVE